MTNGEKGQIEDIIQLLKGKFKELKMNLIGWDSFGLTVIAIVKRLEKLIK
jgi:hypothetical protein